MIKKTDVVKIIQDYRTKVFLAAFPMNLNIDLKSNLQAIDFLNSLLRNTEAGEIKLTDYSQLQQYMQAVSILNNVIELPSFGRDKDSRDAIKKWHKKKFHLPPSSPPKIVLVDEIFEVIDKWHEKKQYIKIPDQYEYEAQMIIRPYYERLKSLPKDKQMAAYKKIVALEKMQYPKKLFEAAKVTSDNGLVALVETIKANHLNKEELINHVYIDLNHDFPRNQLYMVTGYLNIALWIRGGIDDRYRITDITVKNVLDSLSEGNKAARKQKKEAKKEAEKVEDQRATEGLKNLEEKAEKINANDPDYQEKLKMKKESDEILRRGMVGIDGMKKTDEFYSDLYTNMNPETLVAEPSIADYKALLKLNTNNIRNHEIQNQNIDNLLNSLNQNNN